MAVLQISRTWTSLILVFYRIVVLLSYNLILERSSLMFLLVVLVFVGGLLILLVGAATVSYQDQSLTLRRTSIFLVMLICLWTCRHFCEENSLLCFFRWLDSQNCALIMVLLVLLSCLLVLTELLLFYKNALRSL